MTYQYIGPSQMQFPRRELELADAFLDAIPERYRNMPRVKQIKKEALRWSVETMNDSDPSESIRAAEIVPLTASRFEVRHFRYVGGTLLLLIFSEIAGNFHESDAEIMPLVKALIVSMTSLSITRCCHLTTFIWFARSREIHCRCMRRIFCRQPLLYSQQTIWKHEPLIRDQWD